jgi:hypothetical protein
MSLYLSPLSQRVRFRFTFHPRHLMLRRRGVMSSLIGFFFLLPVPCSYPQTTGKNKVTSQSDLPRFTYPVKGSASGLLQSDDATFNAFASKVRADVESTLRDYEIADKATLRLWTHKESYVTPASRQRPTCTCRRFPGASGHLLTRRRERVQAAEKKWLLR